MKKDNLSIYDFENEFVVMGRGDSFSYGGLRALYDYLEDTQPDYDLDVIELCCTYTEYDSIQEVIEAYNYEDEDEVYDNLFVIEFDGGVIISE